MMSGSPVLFYRSKKCMLQYIAAYPKIYSDEYYSEKINTYSDLRIS